MEHDKAVVRQTLARICLHLRELQTTAQSRRACEEIAAWLQQETHLVAPRDHSAASPAPEDDR